MYGSYVFVMRYYRDFDEVEDEGAVFFGFIAVVLVRYYCFLFSLGEFAF